MHLRLSLGRRSTACTLCLALMGTAGVASASPFYIAPELFATFPDNAYFKGEDYNLGLSAGVRLFPSWDIELGYSANRFVSKEGPLLYEQQSGQLRSLWTLGRIENVLPYIVLGGGLATIKQDAEQETRKFVIGGVGYSYPMSILQGLSLQGELHGRFYFGDEAVTGRSSSADTEVMLRLKYRFGAHDAPSRANTERTSPHDVHSLPVPADIEENVPCSSSSDNSCAPQSDRDHDSVPDAQDYCPDTVPGTAVDADGCTAYDARP